MALVAIHAVVDVAVDAGMLRIRLRRRVAIRALKHGVVRRVRVAGGADAVSASMVHRKPGVIEGCAQPIRGDPCCVAGGTGRRKPCRDVIRVRRPVVIGLVARIAIGWRPDEHTADMATGAGHVDVWALEGEWRGVVVENGAKPIRGRPSCVTKGAVLREARGHVIRNVRKGSGVGVILLVAAIASGWQGSRVIICMAGSARDGSVRALERE